MTNGKLDLARAVKAQLEQLGDFAQTGLARLRGRTA
jgi:hypothetical protein